MEDRSLSALVEEAVTRLLLAKMGYTDLQLKDKVSPLPIPPSALEQIAQILDPILGRKTASLPSLSNFPFN